MEKLSVFQRVGTVLFSVLTFLIGDFILPLKILITLIAIDYITGLMKALYLGNLKSREAWKGIIRKTATLTTVVVGNQMDLLLGVEFFKVTICWFLCSSEAISIIENLALMDAPIPIFLKDALAQIHQDSNVMDKDKLNKELYRRR